MIKNYRIYQFSIREKLYSFFEGVMLNAVIAFLFYNSVYAMLPGMILVVLYCREKKRQLARKRMRRMRMELKEFLNAFIAALQTGRSIENAFCEAAKDIEKYLQKETEFVLEMKMICARLGIGDDLVKMLADFSRRSHLEELEYFSEVFLVGKRSGGNLVGIMKNTIRMLQEKMDAEEEISTAIMEKQLEFHLMTVIPLGIILYLRIGAGNLVGSLYGNLTGVAVMTVCLMIYGGCYLYGKRLLEIENGF